MTQTCYCLSKRLFEDCCQPIIEGQSPAATAQELMRSRYTAHALGNIDYLMDTWAHAGDLRENTQQWVESHDWLGLQILHSRRGLKHHKDGTVEFIAYYRVKGAEAREAHHELSNFEQRDGKWFYIDGSTPEGAPKKTGRNDPCPCNSGKKFKRCCA